MATNEAISYALVYKHLLGVTPSAKTYNERITAQKIAYLAQAYGTYIGEVNFFWHKRGPYSRAMTSILFEIENNKVEINNLISQLQIKEAIKPSLEKVKKIINNNPISCPIVVWLEICASILFLSKELRTDKPEVLVKELLKKKPFLKEHEESIWRSINLMLNNNSTLIQNCY
ncbi:hypothetical protein ATL39_1953 [Sinobaca qinghaiensis]|uniref:Uncharacterized protein n=1 Tax=Sinobaca qinghaiensis TaxID=342944 RepID=A0A419V5C5_9BACL|nr:hypothetical protein [Sinobaca qinghaiensis]RKD73651.1 hypothetical protein ATL39_1953 [Sinobaca qinghaiensis]